MASTPEKSPGKSGPLPFETGVTPEWTLAASEESVPASPDKPELSSHQLALVTHHDGKQERLGIFISIDSLALLQRREWQMALEQEIAKVRHRARRFLESHRKPPSNKPTSF